MNHETKAALRDRQTKIDRHVSNLGQASATKYLQGRPQSTGLIREAIAGVLFITLTVLILIIGLAL
jgi:hypothetical protein